MPGYILLAELRAPGGPVHAPALALDRAWPLRPGWVVVYGALYLFLILLPILVVRQDALVRRTLLAYLSVWLAAYACFALYPTTAPRPDRIPGSGFGAAGLRFLYAADPPRNCFPSLHAAHALVSALACHRVHRGVGLGAALCALLVGASTLYTRQHYLVDVLAGLALALGAYGAFLRTHPRSAVPEPERRIALHLALGTLGAVALLTAALAAMLRFA